MSWTRLAYLTSFLNLAPSASESQGIASSTRSTLTGVADLSTSTRSDLLEVIRMSGGIVTPSHWSPRGHNTPIWNHSLLSWPRSRGMTWHCHAGSRTSLQSVVQDFHREVNGSFIRKQIHEGKHYICEECGAGFVQRECPEDTYANTYWWEVIWLHGVGSKNFTEQSA